MNYVLFAAALIVLAVMAARGYSKYKKLYNPKTELIVGGIALVVLIISLFLPCLLFPEEAAPLPAPEEQPRIFGSNFPEKAAETEAERNLVHFNAYPSSPKEVCGELECMKVKVAESYSQEIKVGEEYALISEYVYSYPEYALLEIKGEKEGNNVFIKTGDITNLVGEELDEE